jgi:hypothetical protein
MRTITRRRVERSHVVTRVTEQARGRSVAAPERSTLEPRARRGRSSAAAADAIAVNPAA